MPMLPSQQVQHINVDNILIPGSLGMDGRIQRQIEPFDLDQAVPFRPEYLAGWPAEVYQVALADATIEARGRMSKEARNKATVLVPILDASLTEGWDMGGVLSIGSRGRGRNRRQASYTPTISTVRLDSFMHYVLPVWVGTYRYRGRTYAFAVNGQTGKVGGEAPRGGTGGVLTVVLGVVVVALLGFILWRFWPLILSFFQGLFRSTPAEGTAPITPKIPLQLAMVLMGVFVVILFSVAAQWKKIKSWFGGGEDQEHRRR
jgi:hypothetical protein